MLTEICQYLRNWFDRDKLTGQFVVTDGTIRYANGIDLPILSGQYYRIIGSVFNDGVHIYGTKTVTPTQGEPYEELLDPLTDEPAFVGSVWLMAIPPAFLALADDIEAWTTENAAAINSPFTSESFGGYSYSVRSGSSSSGSDGVTWQGQFAKRLNPWRKI